jgi:hypothetical protein
LSATLRQLASALAFAVLLSLSGCGHPEAPRALPPPLVPLKLEPLVDLVPAASLVWLVELHPRTLVLDGRLAGALAEIFPTPRLAAFVSATGGVDPRETDTLVIASYPSTMLWLAHQFVDPTRVESAFAAHIVTVEGRAADFSESPSHEAPHDRRTAITRVWGSSGAGREQLAIFGVDAVGLEQGRFGPLRAAELFAEERLKRASPALRAEPLVHLATLLGDAPVRAFAPGPFQGDLQHAAGGLLGAATAIGASARLVDAPAGGKPGVAFHIALLGAWGQDAAAASDRLRAVFDLLARSGIGRLLGLAHPSTGPGVRGTPEALTLDLTVDAEQLAKGLYAATAADAAQLTAP